MADRATARDVALWVLHRVSTHGAFASAALRAALSARPFLEQADRALATELVYGVLRRRGALDRALTAKGKRFKDLDPKLHDPLRLAAYQLIFLDRVPDHAAVDAAVDQARDRLGAKGAAQANAILRTLAARPKEERLRPPPSFAADPVGHIAAVGSLPHGLAELLARDLGREEALRFALVSLEKAPLVLRTNRLATTRDALVAEVGGEPGAHPLAVHLPVALGLLPTELPAVVEGRATHQDEASMRVIDLLDPRPGERVLDVCAAPGGKTTGIAERMNDTGEVVAYDRGEKKLAQVMRSGARLRLSAIRIAEVLPDPAGALFDRVLVDAPCSGLGTLRRHPEIRWRFRSDDAERLERLQARVLAAGAERVRPGGVLVYSVCTISCSEGESAVTDLPGFDLVETMRTDPAEPGAPDAFFAAKLVRRTPLAGP